MDIKRHQDDKETGPHQERSSWPQYVKRPYKQSVKHIERGSGEVPAGQNSLVSGASTRERLG